MAIEFASEEDEAVMRDAARPFDFTTPLKPGQMLATAGYGRGDNPRGELVGNEDSDCKVFSKENDFRFMRDPDELNPGEDLVWSFAHGCDVSHGDSGSAIVDRGASLRPRGPARSPFDV